MVIDKNFLRLAKVADAGEDFDNAKLDSVIMALGCLLNLANCSAEARQALGQARISGNNGVECLVSVFNDRAGKAAEVCVYRVRWKSTG